jgi:hypothetical protein
MDMPKSKPKAASVPERIYTTDFVKITTVYRDTKTGRFISKAKAEKLKKTDPGRVKKDTRLILKKKPKGLKLKARKGKPLSKKEFQKIVNYVKRHNLALTLSRKWGVSYREAMGHVRTVERKYKRGQISDKEFGWYVGS